MMEEELMSQRDAAIAVSKELQKQIQKERELFERRAMNAERLRKLAEEELRQLRYDRQWEKQSNRNQLYFAIVCGVIGAAIGWLIGLVITLTINQPLFGFLVVIPTMSIGVIVGFGIAKARAKMQSRHYEKLRKERAESKSSKVLMLDNSTQPVDTEQTELNSNHSKSSTFSYGGKIVYESAVYTKDIAWAIWHSRGFLPKLFHPAEKED